MNIESESVLLCRKKLDLAAYMMFGDKQNISSLFLGTIGKPAHRFLYDRDDNMANNKVETSAEKAMELLNDLVSIL